MASKADITNYDKIASKYIDHVNKNNSWNNMYERPYMLSEFDDFRDKKVLDIGCGTGFYSFYALKQQASVSSVDASQEMLDYVKEKDDSGSLNLFKSDLADGLPFIEDNSQDYIICSLVIHYLENWDQLVKDFHRVLKPSGKVYISTHHPFGDVLVHEKESYFDKYLIHDTWGNRGNRFPVSYFTRSLTDVLKPFLDSELKILKIDEPLPSEEYKHLNSDAFNYLQKNPAFIFLVLKKE
ncbi:MAG: class I SAM-dependent methyltransferase [Balneolaceae bacterium]